VGTLLPDWGESWDRPALDAGLRPAQSPGHAAQGGPPGRRVLLSGDVANPKNGRLRSPTPSCTVGHLGAAGTMMCIGRWDCHATDAGARGEAPATPSRARRACGGDWRLLMGDLQHVLLERCRFDGGHGRRRPRILGAGRGSLSDARGRIGNGSSTCGGAISRGTGCVWSSPRHVRGRYGMEGGRFPHQC